MRLRYLLTLTIAFMLAYALPVMGADYIVKATEGVDLREYAPEPILPESGIYLTDEATARELLSTGMVEYIEEDVPVALPDVEERGIDACEDAQVSAFSLYNDPYYSQQVYFQQNGIEEYIDNYSPSGQVRIAMVDTGINREHQEFAGANIETGYNFVTNTTDTGDVYGHGTCVAGILVAGKNDNMGIAGIVPEATLVPLVSLTKVNGENVGTTTTTARAIIAAVDVYDCDIITCSVGIDSYSVLLEEAVTYAISRGAIVIGAAGNSGRSSNTTEASALSYPASCTGAISVGSTNSSYTRAAYSQKNSRVDVVTCGGRYPLPRNSGTDSYISTEGTSFSAPIITGITALFISNHPEINPEEYRQLLKGSALYLGADYTGEGLPDCMEMERLYSMSEGSFAFIPTYDAQDYLRVKVVSAGSDVQGQLVAAYFTEGAFISATLSDLTLTEGIAHCDVDKPTGVVRLFVLEGVDTLKPLSEVYEYAS